MSPEGVWKSGIADRRSRDIFFVAMARSVGVPAWIDEVTGKVHYQDLAHHPNLKEGAAYIVDLKGTDGNRSASGEGGSRLSPDSGG